MPTDLVGRMGRLMLLGIVQLWLVVPFLVVGSAIAGEPDEKVGKRPNVVLILADDLGFSDVGCYGGEIATPNLDSLAANGVRFTQFSNTGRCWPTRASLLTGYYAQEIRRDKVPGLEPTGYPGRRPAWAPLLPKLLQPANYRSYMAGKWHLDSRPKRAGFDYSYLLNDQARFFNPKSILIDDVKQPPIPPGTDYYATTAIADQVIETLKLHQRQYADQPFFHYVSFTAPHFPLHALPVDIAKYKNRYDAGWEKLRAERWERIQKLGLVKGGISPVERETGAPVKWPEAIEQLGPGEVEYPLAWDSMTDQQRRFQAGKMELHAAMVDRMDQEIGRVIAQLKSMGEFDNTLILFLSDNGGSAELMVRDDGHDPKAPMGSADTHLCLGPGWATVTNTPFRKHKTWVHAGGTSTPLIAHWPKGIAARGELREQPGHVIDVVPTILRVAGLGLAAQPGGPELTGKSLLPALVGDEAIERDWLWWFHDGHAAIRVGDWKVVKTKESEWELYDLSVDSAETRDLSEANPDKRKALVERWGDAVELYGQHARLGLPVKKAP